MKYKNPYLRIVTALFLYAIFLLFWSAQHGDILSRAECCGLYGDYGMYYFPFPSMFSSELSHWRGGPTRINIIGVVLNIILPIFSSIIVFVHYRIKITKDGD